ncbi:MAG: iron ABC transporter permease, partial [Acidimicrobiia bacterium]
MDEHRPAVAGLVPAGRRRPAAGSVLLVGVPLLFLGAFFIYPVASILATGLAPGGSLDLSSFGRVFTDP